MNWTFVSSGFLIALLIWGCAGLQYSARQGVSKPGAGGSPYASSITDYMSGMLVLIGLLLCIHTLILAIVMHRRAIVERSLLAAKAAADQANMARGVFLSTMSHEIRTPMNAMVGMAEMLRETALDAEQETFTSAIQESANALMAIIDDILDFSKIDAGKLRIDLVECNLPKLVDGCLNVLKGRAEQKGLRLICEMAPALPVAIIGDPGRLRQILLNLIGNAVKFTQGGEVTVRVRETGRRADHCRMRFEIRDTGIGIPRDCQDRLFKPFTQIDGSITRQYGGTGLGLAISKQLVELMGGRIGVDSREGVGSTFWFEVPLAHAISKGKPAPEQESVVSPAASPTVETMPALGQSSAAAADAAEEVSILLVEDNIMNQRVAVHQLNALGHRARLAGNGQEALAMLASHAFDLILMDCQMPVMDGFELTRRIRSAERLSGRHINIVAMTANAMRGDRERCLDAGMDDYLTKPILRAQLAKILECYLPGKCAGGKTIPPVLDMARLQELLGNDLETQKGMLSLFITTSSALVAELHAAVAGGDLGAVQSLVHRLAGSGDNLGVSEFAAQLHLAGIAARSGDREKLIETDAGVQIAFDRLQDFVDEMGKEE
jgi:signal transduction histidine kinase/DNA-binding response OmpR family regulator